MSDVFISYAKRDGKEFAEHTWNVLNQTGFTPFFDKQDIPVGADWMKKIDEEIENSSNFALILTEGVRESDYVKYEFYKANILKKDSRITILPFKLNTLSDKRIPEDMRKLQYDSFETKEELARKVSLQVGGSLSIDKWLQPTVGEIMEKDIPKKETARISVNHKLKDDIRLVFEKTCDNFFGDPQKMLTMCNQIFKDRGIAPEEVLSFIKGTIMGMTMAYILYLHGRAPEEWEFGEIAKLLERRASEMITIFQSMEKL